MILPLMQQGCVITDEKGVQHIGTVESAGFNYEGKYLIGAYSRSWGYKREFATEHIRLLSVVFDDGEVYNAEHAYKDKYPNGYVQSIATTTGRVSGAVANASNTPRHGYVSQMKPRVPNPLSLAPIAPSAATRILPRKLRSPLK